MGTTGIPGPTGATSSVPELNLKAVLSRDAAGQAHSPPHGATEDAGTTLTSPSPTPAGPQSDVPLTPERKSHQPGVAFPAQTCSEGSSTWQAAAFAVSVHPKMHSSV